MRRALELHRRLDSLATLSEAVGAMKSLSAHHLRQARGLVEPARHYREGVERALAGAGVRFDAGDGPTGLLVVGADLGLCGGYHARLVAAALERRAALGEGPTSCVGRRTAALLERRGLEIERCYSAPTSVQGIGDLVLALAEDLLSAYADRGLSGLELLSSRFEGLGRTPTSTLRILPIPPVERTDGPRPRYARPARFALVAAREHVYITLYQRILDALAAEHGARLVATQSAERWLDERSERLRRGLMAARREMSTQETIEIAAGARLRPGAGTGAHGGLV